MRCAPPRITAPDILYITRGELDSDFIQTPKKSTRSKTTQRSRTNQRGQESQRWESTCQQYYTKRRADTEAEMTEARGMYTQITGAEIYN